MDYTQFRTFVEFCILFIRNFLGNYRVKHCNNNCIECIKKLNVPGIQVCFYELFQKKK